MAAGTPDPLERACYIAMEREFIERLRRERQFAIDVLETPQPDYFRQRLPRGAPATRPVPRETEPAGSAARAAND